MLQITPTTNTTTSTTTPVQTPVDQSPSSGNFILGGGLVIAILAFLAMYFKNNKTQDQKAAVIVNDATAAIKTDIAQLQTENKEVATENKVVVANDTTAKKQEADIQKTADTGAKAVAADSSNTNIADISGQISKDWNNL